MIRLPEIIEFFKGFDYDDKPLKLDECTKIIDLKLFVESHIEYLKNNSGNRRYKPYFERLRTVYILLTKKVD